MRVLVACEESQRVCIEFRKRGHEAYSCDIIPCSGGHPEWHIKDYVESVINGNCLFETMDGIEHGVGNWDMIIAFPPCTYFSTAGACRMFHKDENGVSHLDQGRFEKMLEMRELFYLIYEAKADKIVIENPTPMKIAQLPPATQVIQPYQFGEPWTKRTLLWLKGVEPLQPTNVVEPINGSWVNSGADYRRKGWSKGKSSSKDRSKTFSGVAQAMAEQWG